ncbi:MAG: LLM class flavin-dependent oxidoreductase [Chitinophagales bacterium]|nr:LLM class flavin-dependent oxidoreductase [Chitinophagales bacterium]
MTSPINIPISLLELALINQGSDTQRTLEKTVEIAQKADELNFKRIWFAEHHNMPHVASSATVVLIAHIAGKTQKIRVGSGGIMLPNHSPLVVAEQFGTLEALFPDRIDLGLGRAPGTDHLTAQALNKDFFQAARDFPNHVAQLQTYLSSDNQKSPVRAFPGDSTEVPIWILGSSMDSAILAAKLGLPYAFASHFAPQFLMQATQYYTTNYQASKQYCSPKTLACINVIVADTNEEAEHHASCMYKMFLNIVRGTREAISPPKSMDGDWLPQEEAYVRNMLSYSFVGSQEKVYHELLKFNKLVQSNELMITIPTYEHEVRLKTLELIRPLFE